MLRLVVGVQRVAHSANTGNQTIGPGLPKGSWVISASCAMSFLGTKWNNSVILGFYINFHPELSDNL